MDNVILTHGLWMSGYATLYWKTQLRRAGFNPIIYSYPSVSKNLDHNADHLFHLLHDHQSGFNPKARHTHFVGHSLGGLVTLHMLRRHSVPHLGRVVLCGSPVNGSFCATKTANWPFLGQALGHSITNWEGISQQELPEHLEVGILAGTRSIGLGIVIPGLEQPNDGTVSLAETRLSWAKDHIDMPINHSEMLVSAEASRQIIYFIQHGHFHHLHGGT